MKTLNTIKPHVLIVDDEPLFSESLKMTIEDLFDISMVNSIASARDFLKEHSPDAILLDVKLPDGEGTEFLREIQQLDMKPLVIMMTAFATVNNAIDALKHGAADYFTKPIVIDKLRVELQAHLENRLIKLKILDLDRTIRKVSSSFITAGEGWMKAIIDKVPLIAPLNIPVLIVGDTGTGKERLAEWIHERSAAEGNMVAINCSALSKDIAESELFGHTKGAFSGATLEKVGLIERADGGTLFLDEISELPEEVQAKFLRVLENGVYYRVGDTVERKVSFRLISATCKDLKNPINHFRNDLFFRINGVSFELPALNQRKEDIPLLLSLFINEANLAYNKAVRNVTPAALKMILAYQWPGNIRELKWAIHRTVATTSNEMLEMDEFSLGTDFGKELGIKFPMDTTISFLDAKEKLERQYIKNALDITKNNKTEAARLLEISARTLHYKLTKYNLY